MPARFSISQITLSFALLCAPLTTLKGGEANIVADVDRWTLSGGVDGLFDAEKKPVLALSYRFKENLAGWHPWLGVGWSTDGAIFAGGGVSYQFKLTEAWHLSLGTGPGYYDRKEGLSLGSHLEFFSFVEISHVLAQGHALGLRLAHISNGGLKERNPGTEILAITYSVPAFWGKKPGLVTRM